MRERRRELHLEVILDVHVVCSILEELLHDELAPWAIATEERRGPGVCPFVIDGPRGPLRFSDPRSPVWPITETHVDRAIRRLHVLASIPPTTPE